MVKNYFKEIERCMKSVIKRGIFILGPEVRKLEQEISQYFGVKYAIGVNSGTDALIYSLRAIGIKTGDEIICPVFTFVGTAEAILWAGGRPVFCDINPQTFNINPDLIERLITKKTKVIIPVHLYGQSADMEKILKIARIYKLRVIEDAAQAFGAEYDDQKVGTIGDAGCLSFFPTKILGAMGDGGMVLTDSSKLAKIVKLLRVDGARKMYYDHQIIGGTSRLHEFQAAVLRVKLKYLRQNLEHRQKIANEYSKLLIEVGDLVSPFVAEENRHVYNYYIIRTRFRDQLKDFLTAKGIKTSILYPKPLHFLTAYKFLNYKIGDFTNAEKVAKEVLALPINEFLPLKEVKNISFLIKKFFCQKFHKQ